ncbi:SMI1/KNR4 family protein [Kitasatospora sp. NPDC088134]|uniref:SMI1/KNR4 family protein n=1 Tax=Kitasatospora sp. NPDC088134 TaxID=3364071 RepID=UPI003829499B
MDADDWDGYTRGPSLPPPLTEAEVAEAERQFGVSFPTEYRTYLLTVSAGLAVTRLERTGQGWRWAGDDPVRRGLLALPFPHPDSYVAAEGVLEGRCPEPADFPDEQSYERARGDWLEECDDFEDRKTAGAIVVQEHGCGFSTLLAITGPLAGTMWWDGRATCELILPLSLDHSGGAEPVTFGQWLGRDSWSLLPPGWG